MFPPLHERDVLFPLHVFSLPFCKVLSFSSFNHNLYGIVSNAITPLDATLICLGPFKNMVPRTEHSGGKLEPWTSTIDQRCCHHNLWYDQMMPNLTKSVAQDKELSAGGLCGRWPQGAGMREEENETWKAEKPHKGAFWRLSLYVVELDSMRLPERHMEFLHRRIILTNVCWAVTMLCTFQTRI